jgi:tRNA (guanine-N7-)-methyltransferase
MTNSLYTIQSNQDGIHPNLNTIVQKHKETCYNHPISSSQIQIFETVLAYVRQHSYQKYILDSGCGTGMSTSLLAQQYPTHLIIGIDKSKNRLAKHHIFDINNNICKIADNAILVNADLINFWMLADSKKFIFAKHMIYYPNPWPKAKHLMRRFHGHPALPHMIKISQELYVRSNWLIYLKEMQQTLLHWQLTAEISSIAPNDSPVSLFEKKYFASNELVFELNTIASK